MENYQVCYSFSYSLQRNSLRCSNRLCSNSKVPLDSLANQRRINKKTATAAIALIHNPLMTDRAKPSNTILQLNS